jgi:hypothetical protein
MHEDERDFKIMGLEADLESALSVMARAVIRTNDEGMKDWLNLNYNEFMKSSYPGLHVEIWKLLRG